MKFKLIVLEFCSKLELSLLFTKTVNLLRISFVVLRFLQLTFCISPECVKKFFNDEAKLRN